MAFTFGGLNLGNSRLSADGFTNTTILSSSLNPRMTSEGFDVVTPRHCRFVASPPSCINLL